MVIRLKPVPVMTNNSLGYRYCLPSLISFQTTLSMVESSSPKIADTRLSYITAASNSVPKSSSGVLKQILKVFNHNCNLQYTHIGRNCTTQSVIVPKNHIFVDLFSEKSNRYFFLVFHMIRGKTTLSTHQLVLLTTRAGLLVFKNISAPFW